jgi:hypothetical protein
MRAVLRGDLIYRGGRHVAALRGDGLFRTFDAQRELFRGALLFHVDVLALANAHGARWLLATERGSGQRYAILLADFTAQGWTYEHKTFGAQMGLELAKWKREIKPGEPKQLGLFAGGGR